MAEPFTSDPVILDPIKNIVGVGWPTGIFFILYMGLRFRQAFTGDSLDGTVKIQNWTGIPGIATKTLVDHSSVLPGVIVGNGMFDTAFANMRNATIWNGPSAVRADWVGRDPGGGETNAEVGLVDNFLVVNLTYLAIASEETFSFEINTTIGPHAFSAINYAAAFVKSPKSITLPADLPHMGVQVNWAQQDPILIGDAADVYGTTNEDVVFSFGSNTGGGGNGTDSYSITETCTVTLNPDLTKLLYSTATLA